MDHSPLTRPAPSIDVDHWRVAGAAALHPSGCDGAAPLVVDIAEGLASVAVPWEMATAAPPLQRQYALLLSTDTYDAWLIYWPPGTGLDAHDHGGSAGAFAVVSGTLEEWTVRGGVNVVRRVAAGESVCFGRGHVHAVANRTDAGATSVHVYAPPLRSMGFYKRDGGELVLDRVDDVGVATSN